MGKRKRRQQPYRNGDISLGRSAGWWVADYRDASTRKRSRLVELSQPEQLARAALDRFAEARRAVREQQATYTVGDLWRRWMQDRERDGFDNSIYNYNWTALSRHFETRAPDLITTEDCRSYARERFGEGRAPATVHTELSRLRGCLAWAHSERLIGPPPRVWVPSSGAPRDRVLSPLEANQLLAGARDGDPHIYLFVVLLFATGGRHRAILDLTWDRVHFDDGIIELDDMLPPDPMNKSWRKGRANVVMSDFARAALTDAHPGRRTTHVMRRMLYKQR